MVKEINRDMICNDRYTEAAESKETVTGGLILTKYSPLRVNAIQMKGIVFYTR